MDKKGKKKNPKIQSKIYKMLSIKRFYFVIHFVPDFLLLHYSLPAFNTIPLYWRKIYVVKKRVLPNLDFLSGTPFPYFLPSSSFFLGAFFLCARTKEKVPKEKRKTNEKVLMLSNFENFIRNTEPRDVGSRSIVIFSSFIGREFEILEALK